MRNIIGNVLIWSAAIYALGGLGGVVWTFIIASTERITQTDVAVTMIGATYVVVLLVIALPIALLGKWIRKDGKT